MKSVLIAVLVAVSASAASACQISKTTEQALIQYRYAEVPTQYKPQGMLSILNSDACFVSKKLQAKEINHVIGLTLSNRVQDKFLAGSINEYLAM